MDKKIQFISGLMCIILLFCIMPQICLLEAQAQESFTYVIRDGGAVITDTAESLSGAITLPSSLGGYPVVAIGDSAFDGREAITSIVIPEGVCSIGVTAFNYCTGLTKIQLPASLESIREGAFVGCLMLERFAVAPDNPTYTDIDGVLFTKDKTSLISYPAGKADQAYTIPSGVVTIMDNAFYRSSGLRRVSVGEGVTALGIQAFSHCENLTQIQLPQSLTSIGAWAFSYCQNLPSIRLPDGVSALGTGTFSGCRNLSNVVLPANLTTIGGTVFNYCKSLTEIAIPENVTAISSWAFMDCHRLEKIALPATLTSIGTGAFSGCTGLQDVYYQGSQTQWADILISRSNDSLTGAVIHHSSAGIPQQFTDVLPGSWYRSAVEYVVAQGLMNGMGSRVFQPNTTMSRAMVVTVLWRMDGEQTASAEPPFSDLTQNWYADAVAWAYEKEIVKGTSATTYAPDDPVTREQLATILHRFCQYKGYDTSASGSLSAFRDCDAVHQWAQAAMQWAYAEGLITGTDNSGIILLDPCGNTTRAQVATILMRLCQKLN